MQLNGIWTKQSTVENGDNQQKQRTYCQVNFVVPADSKVKIKEIEKRDEYLDLARELRVGSLEWSPKYWKRDLNIWKSVNESRLSRRLCC